MPSSFPARLPASFRPLAWSNLAAQSAEQIALAAAPIIAVLAFAAGPAETGALQTAQTLPFLLLAIPAGLLADRMSRRQLMVLAEATRTLSLVAIPLLALLGWLNWPLLAVLGFIGACGTVVYSVAAPAMVPALVPAAHLATANGRIELARTMAFAAGPAIAGMLIGWIGGSATFAVAAALSLWAALLLRRLPEPARTARSATDPWADLREGAVFVFGHRMLRPVFITQFIFGAAFFALQAVYVPYAVHHLGLSAGMVGMSLGLYGLGMIVGASLSGRVLRTFRFGTVVAIGPVTGFIAALCMMATIWWPTVVLAGLSFLLMGAGPILWVISTTTLRQTVTPPALLGRASAINIMAYGARPVGAALGGAVGGAFGAESVLVLAAAGFLLQALVILLSPVPRLAEQPVLAT